MKKRTAYGKRRYVMAMVLGTALSALGANAPVAAAEAGVTTGAINDLSRYCTACWRNARLPVDRWSDCTQEVFTRLLERVEPREWEYLLRSEGEDRREFLRAIDAVKKRTQRDRKRFTGLATVVADERDDAGRARSQEREAVSKAAGELLTLRQQHILQLSFEGWSVQDIAGELGIGAERVSDEKYKAIRRLREHFCAAERWS